MNYFDETPTTRILNMKGVIFRENWTFLMSADVNKPIRSVSSVTLPLVVMTRPVGAIIARRADVKALNSHITSLCLFWWSLDHSLTQTSLHKHTYRHTYAQASTLILETHSTTHTHNKHTHTHTLLILLHLIARRFIILIHLTFISYVQKINKDVCWVKDLYSCLLLDYIYY